MPHLLIVTADFYKDLAEELSHGAREYLKAKGASFDEVRLPGALEIPPAVAIAIDAGTYDGFVALGCVIRGETTHYDYVCQESARGLMDLNITRKAAIGNGILTVENAAQAWRRARVSEGNKGAAAAEAALCLIHLKEKFTS